jgi:hypothetical protein
MGARITFVQTLQSTNAVFATINATTTIAAQQTLVEAKITNVITRRLINVVTTITIATIERRAQPTSATPLRTHARTPILRVVAIPPRNARMETHARSIHAHLISA